MEVTISIYCNHCNWVDFCVRFHRFSSSWVFITVKYGTAISSSVSSESQVSCAQLSPQFLLYDHLLLYMTKTHYWRLFVWLSRDIRHSCWCYRCTPSGNICSHLLSHVIIISIVVSISISSDLNPSSCESKYFNFGEKFPSPCAVKPSWDSAVAISSVWGQLRMLQLHLNTQENRREPGEREWNCWTSC